MGTDGEFNETVHAPLRLQICGLLRAVDERLSLTAAGTRAFDEHLHALRGIAAGFSSSWSEPVPSHTPPHG
jgi:hypothetical protein